jgi:Na+/H+ antiporter NhaD/arsenite permease-like protein
MTWLIVLFAAGYAAIVAEHPLKVNKTATALLMGVLCWVIFIFQQGDAEHVNSEIARHVADIAGILLFLLGAMTVVELIDVHDGFHIITEKIQSRNTVTLLWIISIITFFLSAVLDNLTTAIVMCSLLRKLIHAKHERWFFAGMVVIAANAGGAWSPIGDVTTTMLWLGGQISAGNIIVSLFMPAAVSLLVPLLYVSYMLRGRKLGELPADEERTRPKGSRVVLITGLAVLIFVPVFKVLTHLPPYMGILMGLGVMWILAEIIHRGEEEIKKYTAAHALSRIDVPSILFFFGILAAVAALDSAGILSQLAQSMDRSIGNKDIIVTTIGLASAIVDNVPLVAASMGMYDLHTFPMNHKIWEFLAYAAGTGGSILIIGSAAGVAVMGMEKIDFMWYLKRISFIALLGYFAGALTYIGIYALMHG